MLGWCQCSPRPRGWSPVRDERENHSMVLPAPAGMVPAPRSRGWPGPRAPRARGDGPRGNLETRRSERCSPRPQGWSQVTAIYATHRTVLPAPAGMVPAPGSCASTTGRAPRARGDGPARSASALSAASCSPRPRGWSRFGSSEKNRTVVLPAPAGMVPCCPPRKPRTGRAPRARGDGPGHPVARPIRSQCSPRPRGWSLYAESVLAGEGVLPAPAGMVPPPPKPR